jgi:hypothetical protein
LYPGGARGARDRNVSGANAFCLRILGRIANVEVSTFGLREFEREG